MADDFDTTAITPATWNPPDGRSGGDSPRRRAPAANRSAGWAADDDMSAILGSVERQLPPAIEQSIQALVAEVERLRHEADLSRHYEMFLGEEADRHPVLPVLNRRALLRAVNQMLVAAEEAQVSGAFLYLHVGGVGRLRAVHGLAASDAALAHLAAVLRGELRKTDLIGYLDGGDFGVALALAELAAAEDKTRAIVARLSEQPFSWNGTPVRFTTAVGLVPFNGRQTAEQLLAEADAARRGLA